VGIRAAFPARILVYPRLQPTLWCNCIHSLYHPIPFPILCLIFLSYPTNQHICAKTFSFNICAVLSPVPSADFFIHLSFYCSHPMTVICCADHMDTSETSAQPPMILCHMQHHFWSIAPIMFHSVSPPMWRLLSSNCIRQSFLT